MDSVTPPPVHVRGALMFVLCGLVLLFMLASNAGVWAAAGPTPGRGTVPTPTPRVQPTQTQPVAPTSKPQPTRIAPPTRTPCLNCATPVAVSVSEATPSPVDILVNVGGDEYTDSAGQVWQADQEYVEGLTTWGYVLGDTESGTFVGMQPIDNTADSPLYQDERWAMAGYRFEAPDGRYRVTLKWAEQYSKIKSAGRRVFSVKMQGAVVLKDFDIFAAAGGQSVAVDGVVEVTVSNRLLEVDFVPEVENPTLAAIAIQRILPPAPPAPTSSPTPSEAPAPIDTPPPSPTATPTTSATPPPTATATATALPAAARTAGIFPQTAAALRSADGAVLVRIPAGAVAESMTLIYIPEEGSVLPPTNEGFRLGSAAFSLQPISGAGEFMTETLLQAPVTLTVRYTASDLEVAGGDAAHLVLQAYYPEAQQWLALETATDAAASTLTARTSCSRSAMARKSRQPPPPAPRALPPVAP